MLNKYIPDYKKDGDKRIDIPVELFEFLIKFNNDKTKTRKQQALNGLEKLLLSSFKLQDKVNDGEMIELSQEATKTISKLQAFDVCEKREDCIEEAVREFFSGKKDEILKKLEE